MHTQTLWLLFFMAFISGAFMPLQAGINGLLAREISSTLTAATLSFIIGTIGLLIVMLYQRETITLSSLKNLSWWHWTGGFMGAFLVFTAAFVAPRIGALLFMALVLAGQLTAAVLLDQQGWAGFREAPINLSKILGLTCILAGVWLIRRG